MSANACRPEPKAGQKSVAAVQPRASPIRFRPGTISANGSWAKDRRQPAIFLRSHMAVATNKSAGSSAAQRRSGDDLTGPVPDFPKEQEMAAFRDMLLIRRFEEKAGQLYGMGLIGGF